MPTVIEKTSLDIEIENINNTKGITAAIALRRDILSQPNTILLTEPGKVDRVIRVVPLKSRKLDLGNGPQAEEWREIERQIYTMSRRDRPIPTPVPVSPSTKDEWSLRPDDVPAVFLLEASEAAPVAVAPKAEVAQQPIEAPVAVAAVLQPVPTDDEVKSSAVDKNGRNRGLAADKTERTCEDCGKTFKGHNGLKIHRTTRHKPGYTKQ